MVSNRVNPKTGKRYDWEAEQAAARAVETADVDLQKQLSLLKRQQKALQSKTSFMPFIKFTSPDTADPNDVEKSNYKDAKHHRAVAKVLEAIINEEVEYTFVILTMPPRHGKSEQVSRKLPAWLIGRFPHMHGVVATYNDDFAADFGKDVRTIVKTPQFKQVFPNVNLVRGGGASDKLITTAGGKWAFVGRGGSLTGQGAHCFPAGTLVTTDIGDVGIEQLCSVVGRCRVLSFNKKDNTLEFKRLTAFAKRPRSGLYRVTTASGRVVEATGDHPFWTGHGYTEVRLLTPGDRLLRLVPDGDHEEGCEISGDGAPRDQKALLQSELLLATSERGDEAFEIGPEDGVSEERDDVSDVQRGFLGALARAETRLPNLLREEVRRGGTLEANVARREPAVEGQRFATEVAAASKESLSRFEAVGAPAGSISVRGLQEVEACEAGSPSHRQRSFELRSCEPSDAMLEVPSSRTRGSGWVAEADTVALVEELRREADVYDIEVEDNHNFFANGVCVSNCLILDDLIKDAKEASSQAIRDQAWDWFTKVAMTRRMGRKIVIMTFTRWHSDDPIGRLTDPENPHYNAKLAKKIKIINIPAIAEDDDPLGRKPGEPLWPDGPDRFDLEFLEEQQSLDPLGFAALYQQRPSLLDGDLFKRESIRFYKPDELPEDLRVYGASDHAVATGQRNDFTVLLKVGIDKQSNIYLLECDWRKMKSDVATEAMLDMCRGNQKPLLWWAEKGHISKSIGPFLHKRMLETGVFMNIREVTPVADKAQRAQSIVARVAMGKVFFPKDAFWTEKAIAQMMAFPNGTHDDFVDALAYIGLGLQSQFAASDKSGMKKKQTPEFGTLAWVKLTERWQNEQRAIQMSGGF